MQLSDILRTYHLSFDENFHQDIHFITSDSRKVKENSLFVALKGEKSDGKAYIAQAIKKGACAIILSQNDKKEISHLYPENILISVDNPALFLAKTARLLNKSQPHHITAITGTNGKTSTADFLRQLWHLQHKKAASLGTLGLIADISCPQIPALTTPDAVSLAETCATLKANHIDHIVLEASSHGLEQYRLHGLTIERAAFTNLTRDHLDYHHTIENYRKAKLKLFKEILPPHHIISFNADMDEETVKELKKIIKEKQLTYRDVGEKADIVRILNITPTYDGQEITLQLYGQIYPPIKLPIHGRFQAENALLAASLCWDTPEDAPSVIALLPKLNSVAGRCEYIGMLPNQAAIYVDYAHTPDALEHILKSLLSNIKGKLHVLFGAGGNRDKGKRPLMGKIAASYAHHIILTDDNPRHENPDQIRHDIYQGIQEKCQEYKENPPPSLEIIPKRDEAIEKAISALKDGDILIIAGKGHEQGQIIGNEIHPFDDRLIARTILAKYI